MSSYSWNWFDELKVKLFGVVLLRDAKLVQIDWRKAGMVYNSNKK